MKIKKIVCFGCGMDGKIFITMIKQQKVEVEIEYFLDNKVGYDEGKFNGYNVFKASLENCKGKTIVVTTSKYYYDIKEQLKNYGLEEKVDFFSVEGFIMLHKEYMRGEGIYLRSYKAAVYKMACRNEFSQKKELTYKVYENAVILPFKAIPGERFFGNGGVVDSFGKYVSKPDFLIKTSYGYHEVLYKNEKVVYCGFLYLFWGHFLMDMIVRCWYFLGKDDSIDKYVFIVKRGLKDFELQGNFRHFFRLLGMEEKIEFISEPTQYREVVIPQVSYRLGEYYSIQYKAIFSHVIENALREYSGESLEYKKVFFTRSKATEKGIGIEMLNDFFQKNGFEVIAPELLDLTQMIYMLQNAEVVATFSGTAAHNLLFFREYGQVIILERTSQNNLYQVDVNRMMNLNVTLVDSNLMLCPTNYGDGPHLFFWNKYFDEFVTHGDYQIPDKKFKSKEYIHNILEGYFLNWDLKYPREWTEEYKEAFIESISELKNIFKEN